MSGVGGPIKRRESVNKRRAKRQLKEIYGEQFDPLILMCSNAMRLQASVDELWSDEGPERLTDESEDNDGNTVVSRQVARHQATLDVIGVWDRCAQYLQPKLKAIEVTGEDRPEDEELAALSDMEAIARLTKILQNGIERKQAADAVLIEGEEDGDD